jgi:hypothetical protein
VELSILNQTANGGSRNRQAHSLHGFRVTENVLDLGSHYLPEAQKEVEIRQKPTPTARLRPPSPFRIIHGLLEARSYSPVGSRPLFLLGK